MTLCIICNKNTAESWANKCWKCMKQAAIDEAVAKIQTEEETETEYEDVIICPWCGKTYEEPFDLDESGEYFSEDDQMTQCHECEKYFVWSANVSLSFNSRRPTQEDKEYLSWW